ncbi:MAG: DUF211 domain-containing protein [Methermicoccaceae archaeon]
MIFYEQDKSVDTNSKDADSFPVHATIKRIVLDVLKPHSPSILDVARALGNLDGVLGVNLSLYEVDQDTENIKITIEGDYIEYPTVEKILNEFGAVVHSIDEVAAGRKLVEEVETLQDR